MPQLQRLVITSEQLQGEQIALTQEQQHYLGRVLRQQTGSRFIAMNGKGQWWLAKLDSPKSAHILESLNITTELTIPVTLMVAPAKGNAFDQVVRCTTELGISRLVPLLSERTLLKPSPHKCLRWRRIAIEAAEQSCRQVIPEVLDPMSLTAALRWSQQRGQTTAQYICVTDSAVSGLLSKLAPTQGIILMTGPEGGWTTTEQKQAILAGYRPVSLGRRILKATTAPITALSVIAAHLEQHSVSEQQEGVT
ncbi:Ribosomal RNA small subunit methyltransferase E [Acaryochloris thomasi RCC1774]|uniref:Ribosomal RNA small subunit methyltransferase E n=1 Tax=Acaryochloris thomasi RCC1774 TaxID=1764569 RepID=A0A2W1JN20_9CYAN|nr:16S rRNA (uracil(1498)-N(3))-methyltransferase [Acaryochloris thomasi]PZD74718.1 Ribosomal RNA small subunit methyltransferase E [Acaryochloris thomasi RCC1774]